MNQSDKHYLKASELIASIIKETEKGYLGMPQASETAVLALVSGLHLLIEDVSGVGKTTLIRCLAAASGLELGRIQFTPDLLPGDITGMMIWEPSSREFLYREGPLHHQFILADELNRAPARTQSALLEAMQEDTVTVDGVVRPLPSPFFVAATQNPAWYAGTYKLPESQLDRFGLSMTPGFPDRETEVRILSEFKDKKAVHQVSRVASPEDILDLRSLIASVHGEANILDYAAALAGITRDAALFQSGLSIRGTQHLLRAAQAQAVMQGRSFIIPEDLMNMAASVMRHRLLLTPEERSRGVSVSKTVDELLKRVPVPVK
ncbi:MULTISPECIES: MoxR family ATPase [unclassified Oceanispirochaeta]|uniref:AAA family ATPase n=1 Tax=unclassified Oceanispirochaeta TaxID=2635722 RepID=UPI000E09BD9D|nr:MULTISPECIES: MoxR family ATPase [unclassified Oceanispirochaeta]MBF9014667.1 MoxR family ATPase [Oceanispirochaeta sp. M2]NPD70923.1 MoxR family ATPase [Oceanispirochaeta sp. M1]RDG33757.1 MoxR family ATPase [Oceanispirochaeta sp. M1]